MFLKCILIILVIILSLFLGRRIFNAIIADFKKYVISFFLNMTLTDDEQKDIDKEFKDLYKESSLCQVIKLAEDKNKTDAKIIEILLQIKDFYKDEANTFSNDYAEFLQKIDSLFKMFTIPIPLYMGAITYLIPKLKISPIELSILVFVILVYLYFLARIIWIQSFKDGFTKVSLELPFKIKNISIIQYLKSYILSTAIHLKVQRENLLRFKTKIKYIHAQYIVSSILLILVLMMVYLIK